MDPTGSTFTARNGGSVKGKLVGSWSNAVFDFSTSFPWYKVELFQPARRFTVDLVNLDSGVHTLCVYICAHCALRSAGLPVLLTGSPINFADCSIGSPINSQSTVCPPRSELCTFPTVRLNAHHKRKFLKKSIYHLGSPNILCHLLSQD